MKHTKLHNQILLKFFQPTSKLPTTYYIQFSDYGMSYAPSKLKKPSILARKLQDLHWNTPKFKTSHQVHVQVQALVLIQVQGPVLVLVEVLALILAQLLFQVPVQVVSLPLRPTVHHQSGAAESPYHEIFQPKIKTRKNCNTNASINSSVLVHDCSKTYKHKRTIPARIKGKGASHEPGEETFAYLNTIFYYLNTRFYLTRLRE